MTFVSESETKNTTSVVGDEKMLVTTMNFLAKKGWKLNSSESVIGKTEPGIVNTSFYSYRVLYLERIKP